MQPTSSSKKRGDGRRMNSKQWIRHINAHINPTSDLPRLDEERLERWARLGLLVPMDGEYLKTDLERTMGLLMFERSVLNRERGWQ